jgi:hypothetical protein
MRNLTAIEKGVLVLACGFIVAGTYGVIRPEGAYFFHYDSPGHPSISLRGGDFISDDTARVYGAITALLGLGLGWVTLKKDK